jgi:uncharacterized protein DUF559
MAREVLPVVRNTPVLAGINGTDPFRESARRDRQPDNLLEANGWHILRFNTEEIQRELATALTRVREAINRYGGIEDDPGVVRRFQRDGKLGPGQGSLELFG